MPKSILIALKDVTLAFRDIGGLLLMLAAPFALTVGIGLVTGRFTGNTNAGVSDIPVIIVSAQDPYGDPVMSDSFTIRHQGGIAQRKLVACIDAVGKILTTEVETG